ncbi:MAG: dienelactone hydrolase family protein [Bacteroidia bacterium]|nr:dienelactone hydrolase family protein [Bacteroidia bacterium]
MKHPKLTSSLLVLLFMVLAGGLQAQSAGQTLSKTMKHGGLKRKFTLHLPAGYDAKKSYPLLICMHGRFGTGSRMDAFSGFNSVADREGFIVVYPDGYKRSWADMRGVTPASAAGVDDVDFIRNLITFLKKTYSVDASRVYATGMSNGAFMTFTLACKLSDQLAAVAPVTASYPEKGLGQCEMKHTMPLIVLNGTKDPLVPYGGGVVKGKEGGEILSTDSTMVLWAKWNDWQPAGTEALPDQAADGCSVKVHTWKNSKGKTTQQLYEIVNGGHTWPGGSQYLSERWVGIASQDIKACEVIWAFLKSHTL